MTRTRPLFLLLFLFCLTPMLLHCSNSSRESAQPSENGDGLPTSLPFELTRADVGEPLTPVEIAAFTQRIIAAWVNADIFDYLRSVTYGVPRDNPEGKPYYSVFWTGVAPYKDGDLVTFRHLEGGSAENIMIPNPVLLTNVIAAYRFSGDESLALLADELARGIRAQFMGCVWNRSVPQEDRYVMARAVINNNFEDVLPDGRQYAADYSAWRIVDMRRWNTHFVNIPDNPYWGDIYIQNMRSKDDVCHLFRAAGLLAHFRKFFNDPKVKAGVTGAYDDLKSFARDIADQGFRIRSVDHDGTIWVPGIDLASFVFYGRTAECDAVLTTQLFAYQEPGDVECGNGISALYEAIATQTHMFNYDIIRNFHMGAVLHSLNALQNDMAYELLTGLIQRSDTDMGKTETQFENPDDQERFNGDLAGNLVKYAVCGMPLTSREVRFVHRYYDEAIDVWNNWEDWNLWDDAVPDGRRSYKPGTRIDFQDMTSFLQLCASPFYNDAVAEVVDCDLIRDASNWGY